MVVPKIDLVKDALLELMFDRDKLESKIAQYGLVLAANDNIGLHGELVDAEGFPRSDIDLQQVRLARQQIFCLQNDHKELTKRIEKLLHQLHSRANGEQQQSLPSITADLQRGIDSNTPLCVFAKVNFVSPGSPAEEAGIRVGDEIIEFGSVNSTNFTGNLNQISTVVNHMQNKTLMLKIGRETSALNLRLIPKKWCGHGLLGCKIILSSAVER